jgi:soluble lytic murein transglycosylase-like protein
MIGPNAAGTRTIDETSSRTIASSTSASQASSNSIGRRTYNPLIASVANEFGLDAELLHAIVRTESNYDASAVSSKGAIGLMQVMPETGRRFGFEDLRDPRMNLSAGAAYLKWLLDRFGDDLELALAAYNAGEGAVERYGLSVPPFAETRGYVGAVMARYRVSQSPGRQSETEIGQSGAAELSASTSLVRGTRPNAPSLAPMEVLDKLGSVLLSAPPNPRSRVVN